jgi:hypothetical protein
MGIYLVEYGIGGADKTCYTPNLKHATGLLEAFSGAGVSLDYARITKVERLEQEGLS